ncbi:synaptotagmin-9-like isoform X2 [Mytilus trossulus]|uniref:synaptotagmin-9-like isoform X2 n=1 Tax=Mytilus trossulus TaxID=6551 RepID=UPI003006B736
MESMKEVKEWFLQKCRLLQNGNNNENMPNPSESVFPGGMTPKTIPDFVIPGSGESSRRPSSELGLFEDDISCRSSSQRSSIASCRSSPRTSINGSIPGLSVPKNTDLCRSAPVSPKHESKPIIAYNDNSQSMGYLENISSETNADPLSIAAMSLPHFRAKTSFGFTTLSQSPHTRRKESLFHTGSEGLLSQGDRNRLSVLEALKVRCKSEVLNDFEKLDFEAFQKSKMSGTPSVVVTPSSNVNRPKYERLYVSHLSPSPRSNCLQVRTGRKEKYFRRRSSLVGLEDSPVSSEESIPENVSFTDDNGLPTSCLQPAKVSGSPSTKRHSSPQLLEDEPPTDMEQKPRSSSCGSLTKNQIPRTQFIAEYGELKFAFHFLAASRLFKVTIIKAENLGGVAKTEYNINSYCKVYLMPGKIQKQTTDMIKHTKNPIFSHELTFHSLTLEQLHSMVLRIKILHKAHNLKLPEFLGHVDVSLDNFDLMTENRMWKDIDGKKEREDIGSLEVSLIFLPREGNLIVGVKQAKGLPHHQITGPPVGLLLPPCRFGSKGHYRYRRFYPYVKVELSQPNRSVSRKQTKTKKNTSDPIYDETFNFSISPKMDDLAYTTLTIATYDHEKLRSDELIGQIKFGVGAVQEGEIDMWEKCINSPGVEISEWLFLMDNDDIK